MKTYTVTLAKKIVLEIEAENCFDVDNKAKEACPEGYEVEGYFIDDLIITKKKPEATTSKIICKEPDVNFSMDPKKEKDRYNYFLNDAKSRLSDLTDMVRQPYARLSKMVLSKENQKNDASFNSESKIVCNCCRYASASRLDFGSTVGSRYIHCSLIDTDFTCTSWCPNFKSRSNE